MAAPKKRTKKSADSSSVSKPVKKPPDKDLVSLSKPEQINIEQLFAQAFDRYKNKTHLNQKQKELTHLALIAEEYLSTFALIGYTLEDEQVVIFNMPTSKDEAALVDLLRSTFIDIISNRP